MKWICGKRHIDLSLRPLIMGILNVTPDSFSDGFPTRDAALKHAESLLVQGADILDLGGESTRPGSLPVSTFEELDRVAPIIEDLRNITDRPLSIDTQKEEVAREAVRLGATIINHVSGSLDYRNMLPLLRESGAAYLGMHMRARPDTMQNHTDYRDLQGEVLADLQNIMHFFEGNGISAERLLFDPGIGFGKTAMQCVELLSSSSSLAEQLGRPLVMGLSRKRWLSELTGLDVSQRDGATATASALLPFPEVAIHRVHHVAAVRQSLILKGRMELKQWDWSIKNCQPL